MYFEEAVEAVYFEEVEEGIVMVVLWSAEKDEPRVL